MWPLRHAFVRRFSVLVLVAGLLGLALTAAIPVRADTLPPAAVPDTALNALWDSYGDQGGHWTGGDSTASVPLPDGRTVWLFSDTYLGTVNADGTRPQNSPQVHNTMVVQQSGQLGQTLYGGTPTAPASLVQVAGSDNQYWVADGTVEGSDLKVLYNLYTKTSDAPLDVQLHGTALVTFALPGLTVSNITTLPLGAGIAWGSALLEDGTYTYVYGSEHTSDGMVFLHVARVPAGGLAGAWQFWTGSGWSGQESASTRLLSGVGTAFSVTKVGGQYVLVTQDSNLVFSPSFVLLTAPSPTGPFGAPNYLFQAPEANSGGRPVIVYDARVHPELSTGTKLVMSYNVDSLNPQDNLADRSIYRPRFMDITWPLPVPDPSAVPGTPTGLALTSPNDGTVHASWAAVSGPGVTYRMYLRDVTAGQTYFSQLPTGFTGTSADVPVFKDGHVVEFRVAAVNAAGEGTPTAVQSTTVHIVAPSAPTGLTANADGAGQIHLTWNRVPGNVWYTIYQRDLTDGATDFQAISYTVPVDPEATIRYLEQDHQYEFKVTARNGAGEGPASGTVQAAAHWNAPPVPTGLAASAQPDGTVALSWNAPADLWYFVYERDVTAGEADFTKLVYPITQNSFSATLLSQDHTYEFEVSSTSQGGESGRSAPVQATVHYPVPPVPTGLTVSPQGDGSILLAWTAPAPNLWYSIYQRDVTAGETDFTQFAYPATGSVQNVSGLLQDHTYEFKVASTSQGGDSAPTAPVSGTAHYPAPLAPTGLTVTPHADGTIALSWTESAPDLWYLIYVRDATAGETEFTKLPYPATENSYTGDGYLQDHTYEFKVASTSQGGDSAPTAPVSGTAHYPPTPAPTALSATAGDGQVRLDWTAPAPDLWYLVYVRDVTANQPDFTEEPYPVTDGTSATVGYLANGDTYEFKVTATSQGGESVPTGTVQAVPNLAPPAKVTGLSATAGTDGSIAVRWSPLPTNPWYLISQQDLTAGTPPQQWAYPVVSGNSVTAPNLTNGHTYAFTVTATNSGGNGPASDPAQAVAHYDPPPAPTNLRATTSGDGTVDLVWDPPAPGLYYWMYAKDVTAGQTTFTKATEPGTNPWASWGSLADGHVYQFKISAENAGGEGPASATVQITAHGGLPAAPTALHATAGDGQVTLGWTASATPGAWYWVYWRDATAGQSWRKSTGPVDPSTQGTAYTATALANTHVYQFKVTATNASGDSGPSNVVEATPMPPVPQPPTGLTASAGVASVTLHWTASVTLNVWYWVEYRDATAGQGWQRLRDPLNAAISGTSFTMTPLSGHTFEFRLRSNNAAGDSAPSAVVSATPLPPVAPTGLSATAGVASVALHWTASVTPNVWYWVEYRDASVGQGWQRVVYPVTGGTSYSMGSLKGHSYQFRVRSTGISGESAPTAVVSATPLPPAPPTGLQVIDGNGQVTVRWTASTSPNVWYFVWERDITASLADGSPPPQFKKLAYPVNGTSFVFRPLPPGHVYEFEVQSTGVSGISPVTAAARGKTFAQAPSAPTNLNGADFGSGIQLYWSPSSTPGVLYNVRYSYGSGYHSAGVTPNTTFTFGDATNRPVSFYVCAFNSVGSACGETLSMRSGVVHQPTQADCGYITCTIRLDRALTRDARDFAWYAAPAMALICSKLGPYALICEAAAVTAGVALSVQANRYYEVGNCVSIRFGLNALPPLPAWAVEVRYGTYNCT